MNDRATMLYVSANELLLDSFRLGRMVYRSGFRPKHVISIWRGGTPVGLGVDEYFRSQGLFINHTTIATGSYAGVGEQQEVIVKNLEYLTNIICAEDGLLIIDDVYETGNTIRELVDLLRQKARANAPQDIRVATIHYKPARSSYDELPLYALHELSGNPWIVYPHELADLVHENDPQEMAIRAKGDRIWQALTDSDEQQPDLQPQNSKYYYVDSEQLLVDSIRLGVKIAQDDWHPDFMLALWPGGVLAGLPVHEVYKYFLNKGETAAKPPDHISINTHPTHRSYSHLVLGLDYLAEQINANDNVLIIDTTFRAGRLVNEVVIRLKEALRRNIDHKRIRIASVYYNPNYDATWTARPDIEKPDYYLRELNQEVIYPASIHKLPEPRRSLQNFNRPLWEILYG